MTFLATRCFFLLLGKPKKYDIGHIQSNHEIRGGGESAALYQQDDMSITARLMLQMSEQTRLGTPQLFFLCLLSPHHIFSSRHGVVCHYGGRLCNILALPITAAKRHLRLRLMVKL